MTTEQAEQRNAEAQRRLDFITSLRACADFLERHPGVQAPRYIDMNVFLKSKDDLIAQAKAAPSWEKNYNGEWFYLVRHFGPDLALYMTIEREQVCRRVSAGTQTIPAKPAEPAREIEVFDWVCDEPLLRPASAPTGDPIDSTEQVGA